jgi:hypothetical protein
MAKGEEDETLPPGDIRERIPLFAGARSAVISPQARGMYETRNQLRRIRDRIKSYDDNEMFAKAQYEESRNPQVDWLKDFEQVADEVNEIQREVDELSYKNRGDESDKKRREELKRLQEIQTRLARKILQQYKEKFPND